jgi:hypothetical protein
METAEYRVAHMGHIARQMQELSKRAAALGIKNDLLKAFRMMEEQLRKAPLELGNPVRNTKKQGGVVCVGVIEPIFVRFAVFEREKAVFLLSVEPLSRFFPE